MGKPGFFGQNTSQPVLTIFKVPIPDNPSVSRWLSHFPLLICCPFLFFCCVSLYLVAHVCVRVCMHACMWACIICKCVLEKVQLFHTPLAQKIKKSQPYSSGCPKATSTISLESHEEHLSNNSFPWLMLPLFLSPALQFSASSLTYCIVIVNRTNEIYLISRWLTLDFIDHRDSSDMPITFWLIRCSWLHESSLINWSPESETFHKEIIQIWSHDLLCIY